MVPISPPPHASLIDVRTPRAPRGVVLVLHGGAGRDAITPVSRRQPSVLRMIPVAGRIARAGHGELAVLRLLNAHRGWGDRATPVDDALWAISTVGERFGQLPVCLVGHSLGGRAALRLAGRPEVAGVVALAPWLTEEDRIDPSAGRTPVVIVHGDADRVASLDRAERFARRSRSRADVRLITVRGGGHAMLGRLGAFDGTAAECVAWSLLGRQRGPVTRRLSAGERSFSI